MKRYLLLPILLLSAAPAGAQSCGTFFNEGFTDFYNVGGWGWSGVYQVGMSVGGNPEFHVRSSPLHISRIELRSAHPSEYTGDYRADKVTSLGIDLFAVAANADGRPLCLVLERGDRFVFYVTRYPVPGPDGDWHSYTVDVPSQATTLPPGWGIDPQSTLGDDATWNLVTQDVQNVRWSLGHPLLTYRDDDWQLSADNLRVAWAHGPSSYCSAQLNSDGCSPALEWFGVPSASSGQLFLISAEQMVPDQYGLLLYGFASASTPFSGGELCVAPPIRRTAMQNSGGAGQPCEGIFFLNFNARIASGVDPSLIVGATVYCQYWSRDPGMALGTSLSNALRFTICP